MGWFEMIEVHLYGKLRQFADDPVPTSQSIARVSWQPGDAVETIIERLGIPTSDLGSNIFLNGRYATLETRIQDDDRLGLFPDDMQLLYKWYFAPSSGSAAPSPSSASGSPESGEEPRK